jgi:hypothetical protein
LGSYQRSASEFYYRRDAESAEAKREDRLIHEEPRKAGRDDAKFLASWVPHKKFAFALTGWPIGGRLMHKELRVLCDSAVN